MIPDPAVNRAGLLFGIRFAEIDDREVGAGGLVGLAVEDVGADQTAVLAGLAEGMTMIAIARESPGAEEVRRIA